MACSRPSGAIAKQKVKRLGYLSMEFLMGRWLSDNLCNLGLGEQCRAVLAEFGVKLEDVLEVEPDAGLGNGGLGRLAACFLESLATMGMPGFGYGIDYEYGMFKQEIVGGFQREKPDQWKSEGTPFYIERPQDFCTVPMYGRCNLRAIRRATGGRAGWTAKLWSACRMICRWPATVATP